MTKMRRIEVPDFPILRGEDAIDALQGYIRELDKQKKPELTKNQKEALMKLANGLISAIKKETENQKATTKEKNNSSLVAQLKKSLLKRMNA